MYFHLFVFGVTLVVCGIQAKEYVFTDETDKVCIKMNLTGDYAFPDSVMSLDNASASAVDCKEDIRTVVFFFTQEKQFNLTFQKFSRSWVLPEVGVAYLEGGQAATSLGKEDNFLPFSVKLGCYFQQDAPLFFNVSNATITLTNVTIIQPFAEDAGGDFGDCMDAGQEGSTVGPGKSSTITPGAQSTTMVTQGASMSRLGVSTMVFVVVGGALLAY